MNVCIKVLTAKPRGAKETCAKIDYCDEQKIKVETRSFGEMTLLGADEQFANLLAHKDLWTKRGHYLSALLVIPLPATQNKKFSSLTKMKSRRAGPMAPRAT